MHLLQYICYINKFKTYDFFMLLNDIHPMSTVRLIKDVNAFYRFKWEVRANTYTTFTIFRTVLDLIITDRVYYRTVCTANELKQSRTSKSVSPLSSSAWGRLPCENCLPVLHEVCTFHVSHVLKFANMRYLFEMCKCHKKAKIGFSVYPTKRWRHYSMSQLLLSPETNLDVWGIMH